MKASAAISPPNPLRHLARLTLVAFLLTFIASRTLVILIMARKMPDLFLHLGGTHVHHLNYGIFLLSAVAGVLLFAPLNQTQRSSCALIYGVSMALTFDEFGMWLHLGGSYWQRASFDAVVVILGTLGLLAFAPRWRRLRAHHFAIGAAMLLVVPSFCMLLIKSLNHANDKLKPRLIEMEKSGPS
jgi:glucose dehydrogenase